jgi:hypothetical protein
MFHQLLLAVSFGANMSPAMAIDLNPLWNFDNPGQSEQRFRAALAAATGDDAIVLQTQIARSYGLRGDFPKARETQRLEQELPAPAGPRPTLAQLSQTPCVRRSSARDTDPDAKEQAREAYKQAYEVAKRGGWTAWP